MKDLFSALPGLRWLKPAALVLGLLGAGTIRAQAQPSTIYALGTVTNTFSYLGTTYNAGSQVLANVSPTTGQLPTVVVMGQNAPVIGQPITGIQGAQTLVGIDFRPSTGGLYALGFDATAASPAANAQVYTLNVSTGALTPVGAAIRLELADNDRNNTRGVIPNIGFDFNPRLDRIRVVAPNKANYRLNPNTGGIALRDTDLSYVAGAVPPPTTSASTPYIGTAAYTNSRPGLRGTVLYDIDVARNNAVLSTPSQPNDGKLTPVANVQFYLPTAAPGNQGPYDLTSPTVGLGLDVYNQTTAYLIEARLQDNTQQTITSSTAYTSNFYTFNLGTGLATRVANIIGGVTLFYSDIAAPVLLPKFWTGQGGNTAWDNSNNWYPTGVPTSNDDVVINGTGTFLAAINITVGLQPVVSNAQQAASVTLGNNALLTTDNGGTLTLAGDFVNNDSQVAGSGTGIIVLAGTSALDISGNVTTSFWNLGVGTAGVATSSPVSIRRSVQVSGTLAIGTGQAFTLLSSGTAATNTTAYAVNNAGGTITGIATVQRYISSPNTGLGYRHYSSPVSRASTNATSNTVADLATSGFAPVVNAAYNSAATPKQVRPYPTVFAYDQARLATSNNSYVVGDFDNGFFSPAALTDTLSPTRGYTVNIPGTELVDFQGKLRTGNYSSGPLARGAQTSAGYHLLGNPYPGSISYATVYGASAGIADALYVYRSTGQYTGSYSTYISTTNQGVNGGTNNIPVAQGFFVRAQPGGGTVNFTNAARTNTPETALFQRTSNTDPTLALTVSGNSVANQTRIYFDPSATSGYDATRDGYYLPATHGLDLSSDIAPEAFSINGLPELTGATVAVPLRVHARAAGSYTLTVDELANLPGAYSAYLRDNLRNTYTDLATTPSLTVALDPADAATGRFTVIFSTTQPLANAPATLAALVSLYPNPAHGAATLVLPQALRGQAASQVEVLNALGQVVLRRTVAASSPEAVELPLTGLAAGLYTVRAVTATGAVARQLRVE